MKIVCWYAIPTGYEGHGKPLPDDIADEWVSRLNASSEEIYHWSMMVIP